MIKNTTGKKILIIGSGIGGLALGIRLQHLGFKTQILEKLDKPGGRAYTKKIKGFTFDMGPTVLTVPYLFKELLELGGTKAEDYLKTIKLNPFYRIYFADKSYFDYTGSQEDTIEQIKKIDPSEVAGYLRFHQDVEKIFQKGFVELGDCYFDTFPKMLKVIPELFKLKSVGSLYSFVSKYFKHPKLRQIFSFETLLIGGNPLKAPAIYSMIHFVEKNWGIHYAMGGTGKLVQAFLNKYQELGGQFRPNFEVQEILIETNKRVKKCVGLKGLCSQLQKLETIHADAVVSNAGYGHTYLKLIKPEHRKLNPNWLVKKMQYSMSLVVIYFGFKKTCNLDLQHHNIILGPRYEGLLQDIFSKKVLAKDFSQYLHIPTLSDPELAPKDHHAAYTLVPVPNQLSKLDWSQLGQSFVDKILKFLDQEKYIPDLQKNLVYSDFITPDYFENTLNSYLGNGFGVEPILRQSAYFRPHNQSSSIRNLFLVGASTQPGAGTPSVMLSAKITARAIKKKFGG